MDRKGRPLVFAVGAAIVSAAALAVVEWPHIRAWFWPPQAGLPAPEEVARMEAAVWASGSRGLIETDIPRFVVPGHVASRLMKRFRPNTYIPKPSVQVDAPLGELVVTAINGRVTRVLFYETGSDDLIFTVDGEHFFEAEPRDRFGHSLGGSLLLAGTLRHAFALSTRSDQTADATSSDYPWTDPGPLVSPPALWPPPVFPTPR